MCRRLLILMSLCVVLTIAANVSAELMGHWKLDEGSGTTTADSSGKSNNATIIGNPKWVTGVSGLALEFDGDDRVHHNLWNVIVFDDLALRALFGIEQRGDQLRFEFVGAQIARFILNALNFSPTETDFGRIGTVIRLGAGMDFDPSLQRSIAAKHGLA